MIGRTVSHFRILSKLGEGGMGVVYRAEDERLRRPVALKVLPADLVADEERRLRFLREARAAAAVSHPNIAGIYETGEADGVVFIAMELVEGKTLRALLGDRPLPVKDALRIAVEIAEGLAEAHKAGVVHRDLKPDNVCVRPDGHVKVLDFGLAKLLEPHADGERTGLSRLETISGEMTREGRVFGTVAYMSPEQARGLPTDPRSDQFSFGVTLYEMLAVRVPFRGKTPTDTLTAIIRDDPEPPSSLNADIPSELERIIGKCLEKDPDERYQDTRDLAVDLRKLKRVTDSGVQTVRTPGTAVEAVRAAAGSRTVRGRRARRAILLGSLALLGAAGMAALWGLRMRPAPGPAALRSRDKVIVADFENTTGRPEFDTAVRDALEHLLAQSTYLDVLRGDRLRGLLGAESGSQFTRLDASRAEGLCRGGACAGYLAGRIGTEGSGFRLDAALHRAGGSVPAIARSGRAAGDEEVLAATDALVLDLRRALGESPKAVGAGFPPTTRSLAAYQAYALSSSSSDPMEGLSLLKRAVETDPGFVEAYWDLGVAYQNLGDDDAYRDMTRKALAHSSSHPEQVRLTSEILSFDAAYEFDRELERLRTFTRLYPYDQARQNWLGWVYQVAYEDPPSAEPALRAAFEISPYGNLFPISMCLSQQGKAEEVERLAADLKARGGSDREVGNALMWAALGGESPSETMKTIDRLEKEHDSPAAGKALVRLAALLAAGKLAEARQQAVAAWREAVKARSLLFQQWAATDQAWLEARRTGRPPMLSPEQIALAGTSLLRLSDLAVKAVDMGLAGPLEQTLRTYETKLRGSTSRYVREELEFARGCLALIHGDAQRARDILEPLARSTEFQRRHSVLGRTYEALGLWREAAAEYEAVLKNPHQKVAGNNAMWTLHQFRLARVYERLGDTGRARRWYGRFLDDWKDADPDIPEVIEARKRLAALGDPGTAKQ